MKIYFVGSHCCGKTTLARWTAEYYGLPLINEVVRSELSSMETTLEDIRLDPERAGIFQAKVMGAQITEEANLKDNYVSDRCFDNLAYAYTSTLIGNSIHTAAKNYITLLKLSEHKIFFVRPHRALLRNDSVRVIESWEEVIRIDGMVKLLLEFWDFDYISIDTVNPAERQRLIRAVLGKPKEN